LPEHEDQKTHAELGAQHCAREPERERVAGKSQERDPETGLELVEMKYIWEWCVNGNGVVERGPTRRRRADPAQKRRVAVLPGCELSAWGNLWVCRCGCERYEAGDGGEELHLDNTPFN